MQRSGVFVKFFSKNTITGTRIPKRNMPIPVPVLKPRNTGNQDPESNSRAF